MTCANNCKGVNPNAVIIGGTAVLSAAALTPLQVLTIGVEAAVAAGGGAVALSQIMSSSSCPATRPCNVSPCFSNPSAFDVFVSRDPVLGTPTARFAAE